MYIIVGILFDIVIKIKINRAFKITCIVTVLAQKTTIIV